ncbi:MAG: type II secretion system protein GspG [Candidatus Hydrogenedentes bacterium]|nr:type II secretion system protein GspG [Candidatus Hydrogenedentota bacterium]
MKDNAGFTLIELILVTIIIGILAGMVVINVAGRAEEARVRRAHGDIATYQNAIDLYALDHNDKYPKSLNELMGGKRDYVRKLTKDPWGNDYVVVVPGKYRKNSYDLYSRGPDGIAGNGDDITSWSDQAPDAAS